MDTKTDQSKDVKSTILIENVSSVCTSIQETQRLAKFFEILIRIDKKIKKENETNNK